MYQRQIPRDLYNESKLLKCLGQLALYIHNGHDCAYHPTPLSLRLEHDDSVHSGFEIDQSLDDGGLYCRNVNLYINDEMVNLYHRYNDKDVFTLLFEHDGSMGEVFNNDGTFSKDFLDFVAGFDED